MKRKIIQIDETKCTGCGQCIPDCPEGALQLIEGKARLVSDLFCDGLGACIGTCPEGAISVIEREAAQKFGYEEVNVVPQPKAGGSFATTAYATFAQPVAVEEVHADAGMDIGGTLIGMHLKRVAVPVRIAVKQIGEANLLCARTRPKFIGGVRAHYDESKL